MKTYTVKELKDRKLIIFDAVMGSRAYGTDLPTSDYDTRGVFVQPLEDILKYGYVEQVSEKNNDVIYYELKRFLELVKTNNPNILELLNAPEETTLVNTDYFKLITAKRKEFVTKQCKNSFAGYAVQQIKKARGLKKKINWDEKEMVRKTVLDFCYVLLEGKSTPLKDWLKIYDYDQSQLGLCAIDHGRDMYGIYGLQTYNIKKGIVKDEETANDVQLCSFPKDAPFLANMIFNKDGYSTHCKRYKEYQTWLENRNEDRYRTNQEHGKGYDSKNMMHTYRLLNMSTEIATTGEIKVRRDPEEIEMLMKIRLGEYDYDDLLAEAEAKLERMDQAFDKSDLPESVDNDMVVELLYNVRTTFYNDKIETYINSEH